MHKIVVGEININSVGNKFDSLTAAVARNIVILLIAETKIDSTKANFILMDITYRKNMTVTLVVVTSWFMFTVTLDPV